MKVKIYSWEVEIKARRLCKYKSSKLETLRFLNFLSMVFDWAEQTALEKGIVGWKNDYKTIRDDLFNICQENGLYNNSSR